MNNYINKPEINDFKDVVKQWLSLDDDIRKLNEASKELKKKKKI